MWKEDSPDRPAFARAAVRGAAIAAILLLGSCDAGPEAMGPERAPMEGRSHGLGGRVWAGGGGHFVGLFFPGAPGRFAFAARQRDPASGDADGRYRFSGVIDGLSVEIQGRITCMTVDPQNPGRAWMGGVITRNRSEHPLYTGPTSQPGRDSWFRVVDYGEGAGASQPDRVSFIFVEPTGGFTRARDFCDARLWFPEDRLTNPLSGGNIQVVH